MKMMLLIPLFFLITISVFAVRTDPLKFHISNLSLTDMVNGPWMYDLDDPGTGLTTHDGNCYSLKPGASNTHLNAFKNLEWSTSGTLTTSTLLEHSMPSLISGGDVVTVTMNPYVLTGFNKDNTVDPSLAWNIYGQAGDRRDYSGGICHFYTNGVEKMRIVNCTIVANSPYQNASQIRALLVTMGPPYSLVAANWQKDVGSGGNHDLRGWGYLDSPNTDPAWAAVYANPYGNQVFFDITNVTYTYGPPNGQYSFDLAVDPATHEENVSIEQVPIGNDIDVSTPSSELDTHFITAISGGATSNLRGYTVTEVLTAPGGIYPAEILTYASKYWQLSTTLASFNADITFNIAGLNLGNQNSLRILSRPFYSNFWTVYPLGSISIIDATHIKALGVTSFVEWTIASIDYPPPLSSPIVTASFTNNSIQLNWDAVSGATSYRVESSNYPDGNYIAIGQPTINSFHPTNYTLPTGDNTTYVYYRVTTSSRSRVESAPSETVSIAITRLGVVGLNLVGVPFTASSAYASSIASNGNVDMIASWDASMQNWNVSTNLEGFFDNDFELTPGMVCFVNNTVAGSYCAFFDIGSNPTYSIDIVQGYNFIRIPYYTPYSGFLLNYFPDNPYWETDPDPDTDSPYELYLMMNSAIESISQWDANEQYWQQYLPNSFSNDWGTILPNHCYSIYSPVAIPNWFTPSRNGGVK